MPTINKIERKPKSNQKNEHSDSREMRHKAYNTTRWKKLRLEYIKQHPICEDCLAKGKVTAASDVHHKNSPFKNGQVNEALLYDENNLMALCKECHAERHLQKKEKTAEEILKALDELFAEI